MLTPSTGSVPALARATCSPKSTAVRRVEGEGGERGGGWMALGGIDVQFGQRQDHSTGEHDRRCTKDSYEDTNTMSCSQLKSAGRKTGGGRRLRFRPNLLVPPYDNIHSPPSTIFHHHRTLDLPCSASPLRLPVLPRLAIQPPPPGASENTY